MRGRGNREEIYLQSRSFDCNALDSAYETAGGGRGEPSYTHGSAAGGIEVDNQRATKRSI